MFPSARRLVWTLWISASWILPLAVADHGTHYKLEETILETALPKPLSDHTGTLSGTTVYIAGGCDDPNGNQWNATELRFNCGRISASFYAYDLTTQTFTNLTDMPVARYRHAAAAGNGKIWIHGGRSQPDDMITTVDVYDIAAGTWSSIPIAEEEYQLSDHTGFSNGDYVYFVGGFVANYTVTKTTFRINTLTSNAQNGLSLEGRANMQYERGDIHSAFTNTYAMVAGGFTHNDYYCEPHIHAEQYNFAADTWTKVADMSTAGAERLLATVDGKIYALGGEKQLEGLCDVPEDQKPEPGDRTILLDTVERYDVSGDKWTQLADLNARRFRYVAIGYLGLIYTFGGQVRHDSTCNCFKTSDQVATYKEVEDPNYSAAGDPNHSAASSYIMVAFPLMVGTVVAALATLF